MRNQPPSGGCELKPLLCFVRTKWKPQPPSGGCELKPCRLEWHIFTGTSRLRAAVS